MQFIKKNVYGKQNPNYEKPVNVIVTSLNSSKQEITSYAGTAIIRRAWEFLACDDLLAEAGIVKRSGVQASNLVFNYAIIPLIGAESIVSGWRKISKDGFLSKLEQSYNSCAINRLLGNKRYDWFAFNKLRMEELQTNEATRALKKGLIVLDDVIIKKSGKHMEGIAYVYDPVEKRYVLGYNLVILYYTDKRKGYPLNFEFKLKNGVTRIEIALKLIEEVSKLIETRLITFDCWYFSLELVSLLRELGFTWVTRAKKSRIFILDGKRIKAKQIIKSGKRAVIAELPNYGEVKLVVVKIGKEKKLLVTNDLFMKSREMKAIYSNRFEIDNPFFKESKQELGLANFHTRSLASIVAHVAICFLSYTLLALTKLFSKKLLNKSIAWLKENLIATIAWVKRLWGKITLVLKPSLRWIISILSRFPH